VCTHILKSQHSLHTHIEITAECAHTYWDHSKCAHTYWDHSTVHTHTEITAQCTHTYWDHSTVYTHILRSQHSVHTHTEITAQYAHTYWDHSTVYTHIPSSQQCATYTEITAQYAHTYWDHSTVCTHILTSQHSVHTHTEITAQCAHTYWDHSTVCTHILRSQQHSQHAIKLQFDVQLNIASLNAREILTEPRMICAIKEEWALARGLPRGLILIRRNISWKVEMTVLQIVTTKYLIPNIHSHKTVTQFYSSPSPNVALHSPQFLSACSLLHPQNLTLPVHLGGRDVCVFLTNRPTYAIGRTVMKSQDQLHTSHFTRSATRLHTLCTHFNTYFHVYKWHRSLYTLRSQEGPQLFR